MWHARQATVGTEHAATVHRVAAFGGKRFITAVPTARVRRSVHGVGHAANGVRSVGPLSPDPAVGRVPGPRTALDRPGGPHLPRGAPRLSRERPSGTGRAPRPPGACARPLSSPAEISLPRPGGCPGGLRRCQRRPAHPSGRAGAAGRRQLPGRRRRPCGPGRRERRRQDDAAADHRRRPDPGDRIGRAHRRPRRDAPVHRLGPRRHHCPADAGRPLAARRPRGVGRARGGRAGPHGDRRRARADGLRARARTGATSAVTRPRSPGTR